ncbi:tyrosine-type recombinase/integrase [Pseudoduganella aquatica]|uniref:Tyrosine-type recombinase/integrase n=1 Tax=Pseudoduganella aquatica TaxID=2660641 RepID=A0A7X4HI18_9BURK|nr:tyrosine-type recombinase/integrase [Pseudoduganella aquatica]MYN11389.1 tyrosine-type recombinase/integrase [Pseudoduganella aquatica]
MLKKKTFKPDEIAIFDEAIIHKRNEIWQFQMWLEKEGKYAHESLRTRNRDTAIDKAKKLYIEIKAQEQAGKTYFSKTTKQGVEEYLKQRATDVDAGLIVKGRFTTIKTHLEHWLDFIHRDTKLKELERTDCENYYHSRTKTKKGISISQTTVENEQSTINAMISWLYKRNETYIDAFDFKKLPRIDKGDAANRRDTFTLDEIQRITKVLEEQVGLGRKNVVVDEDNLKKIVVAYYFLIAIVTGLRKGEQVQLRWSDVEFLTKDVKGKKNNTINLVKITVRAETSKVRKTRRFYIEDWEYFDKLFSILYKFYTVKNKDNKDAEPFGSTLVFSVDGKTAPTPRVLALHFEKLMENAEIQNTDTRDLVPYSFRHYFITKMVNRGLPPIAVAETCGTSVVQIDNTYYHTTEAKMLANVFPDHHYKDGYLVPK